jgi:hypothetical protein
MELVIGQGGWASHRLGVEAARCTGHAEPAVQGDAMDAEYLGNRGGRLALTDGGDSAFTEMFAFSSGSGCSHTSFYASAA